MFESSSMERQSKLTDIYNDLLKRNLQIKMFDSAAREPQQQQQQQQQNFLYWIYRIKYNILMMNKNTKSSRSPRTIIKLN